MKKNVLKLLTVFWAVILLLTACQGVSERETDPATDTPTQAITDGSMQDSNPETETLETEGATTEGEDIVIKEPIIPIVFE